MFGSAKVFAVPRPIIRKFLLPNLRHHVKDKYPFPQLHHSKLPRGFLSSYVGLSCSRWARPMVCSTFTSNASACRTMEINAVGDFSARYFGSWVRWHLSSTRPFSLHISFVYLPETRHIALAFYTIALVSWN